MYLTHVQAGSWARDLSVVIRAAGDAVALAAPVRRAVADVDPGLPLTRAGLLTDRISASVAEPRFRTILLAAFSVLALLLAVVGTYGVMAFVVAQRRHEIGVRMALGADARRITSSVLGEGLRLAAVATGIGLVGALAGSRLLRGLLYGVAPLDPRIHGTAALVLVLAALAACWLPARRASRVDPLRTLKD
jgi:predicted lysophospholipase L1 biosynthesis ABC-type transport system permease subunit